ncbi:hypothetical protein C5167_020867 [Papaver somniferum]|uniref:MSP domain-containing protein n=1 Tax=Papaver somniferum TaxID=3469 RepID=A0A4Y7IWC0_PAPSO|nr:hypothetical protein C5167_020867 [Papaver somniferum]
MGPELLEIQPQELKFTSFVCIHMSFNWLMRGKWYAENVGKVKTTSPKRYCVRPNIGVVQPRSTCDFTVTMQAQKITPPDMQCKDKFLVQSTIVPFGTTEEDITASMFAKDDGRYIEENKLRVILVSPPHSPVLLPINGSPKQDLTCLDSSVKGQILKEMENYPLLHTCEVAKVSEDLKLSKSAEEFKVVKDVHELKLAEDVQEVKQANDVQYLKQSENVKDFNLEEDVQYINQAENVKDLNLAEEVDGLKMAKNTQELSPDKNVQDLKQTKDVQYLKLDDELKELKPAKDMQEWNLVDVAQEIKLAGDVQDLKLAQEVQDLKQDTDVEKLKLAKDVEELELTIAKLGSMLNKLESKLSEAEATNTKLRKETSTISEEKLTLQQEISMLKTKNGVQNVQKGFPSFFVLMVALISLILGFKLNS